MKELEIKPKFKPGDRFKITGPFPPFFNGGETGSILSVRISDYQFNDILCYLKMDDNSFFEGAINQNYLEVIPGRIEVINTAFPLLTISGDINNPEVLLEWHEKLNKQSFIKEYSELCKKYQLEIVMEEDYGDDCLIVSPLRNKEETYLEETIRLFNK